MDNILPIQSMIYEIHGFKVMLDCDLAQLYQVETKVLNQAVNRNLDRFPEDFMFQPSKDEFANLKSQFVTSSWGGRRKLPYAFTEQGVAMLSGVLRSAVSVKVNIQIMRAFVQMRNFVFSEANISDQIAELRKLLLLYIEKNDKRVNNVLRALDNLIEHPPAKKVIGFTPQ